MGLTVVTTKTLPVEEKGEIAARDCYFGSDETRQQHVVVVVVTCLQDDDAFSFAKKNLNAAVSAV